MRSVAPRYNAVAIVLHWTIAAAIIGNTLLGWWMHRAIQAQGSLERAIAAFQMHKSIGLTILALSLMRLLWRWLHRPPPLPAHMSAGEKLAAKAACWAFYALMIGVPLSGWLYVSTQWRADAPLNVPTLWFGLVEIPHLFGLNDSARAVRESLAGTTLAAHELLVWSMVALLALHITAALKHHFIDRDEVLGRMMPVLRRREETSWRPRARRRTILIGGFAALAIAAIAVALMRAPSGEDDAVAPAQETQAAIASAPGGWVIDPRRSEIAFSGVHAGVAFRGRFTRWNADLRIDPADVTRSRIVASIETGSATDGVPLHDASLPQAEWFDIANHPLATFRATRIHPRDSHRYDIDGTLTIKARAVALSPLTLQIEGDQLTISGRVEIDRSAIDMGMQSDPDAAWVSRTIVVDVQLIAARGS